MGNFPNRRQNTKFKGWTIEQKREKDFLQEANLETWPIFALLSFSLPQTTNEEYQASET